MVLSYNRIYTLDDNGNIIKGETVYAAGSSNQNYVEEWLDYDDKQNLVGPQVGDVVSKNNHRRYIQTKNNNKVVETVMVYSYKNDKYVEEFNTIDLKSNSYTQKATVTWEPKESPATAFVKDFLTLHYVSTVSNFCC